MSYRDVSESLRAYRERIANDLDEARCAAREAAERASKVAILERELAETETLLAKMGVARRGLPVLDDVRIAAPCKADWDGMAGDDHVRFCVQCEKNVYNLSSLSREEAEALLAAKEGKMCVRIFRREDGTVLTDDCPVGVKRRRRRRAAVAAVGGGIMAAAAAMGLKQTASATMGSAVPVATAPTLGEPTVEMGDPAPSVPVPAPTTSTTGQWLGGAIAPIQRLPKATPLMGKPAIVRTK
jgi:hypothetical protein